MARLARLAPDGKTGTRWQDWHQWHYWHPMARLTPDDTLQPITVRVFASPLGSHLLWLSAILDVAESALVT